MRDPLFDSDPFQFTEAHQQLFFESLKNNFIHHFENCENYRNLLSYKKFDPYSFDYQNLSELPFVMVNLYKTQHFQSQPDEKIVLTLTSSGTGGQKSVQRLDQHSLEQVKHLAYQVYKSLGATSQVTTSYMCFTYDPHVAKDLGTAFTDELLTSFTPREDVFYSFQWDETKKDFVFLKEQVIATLKKWGQEKRNVRILGFPAFLWDILQTSDIQLNLGSDSWLLTGGGWKNHADQEISKAEFRLMVEQRLGIPRVNCRDLFGMVEHGIPYVDCKDGFFRIPNYSRVLVRDPYTLKVLPFGETGLIQFICSYNTSYPCSSILTTDWGRVIKSTTEHPADILELKGRAGLKKHKGCALKALELLESNP
jgi:phenylacetate-coenzyme A ligase PaaK-like adenylate-forming protein